MSIGTSLFSVSFTKMLQALQVSIFTVFGRTSHEILTLLRITFTAIHSNSIDTRHLNGSKLHLNVKGTKILFSNFVEAISNILL